jgi:hypothetical protein
MSIARLVTVGLVRAGIRAATTGSADSPQAIMADAEDPNVPAVEVMARAAGSVNNRLSGEGSIGSNCAPSVSGAADFWRMT